MMAYGSHTLRGRQYASKPQPIEGITLTNSTPPKITNGYTTNKSTSNSDTKTNIPNSSSIKTTPISTHTSSSSSPPSSSSKSHTHKHHKKKRTHRKPNNDKHTHAPILIFPYSWNLNTKDTKCENNKQFHKKCKPLSARISIQHGIDHLLSPSKCSKRYLSAYCLNLHQLTTSPKLIECIIKKLTPVIKQLHHITNDDKNINTVPTIGTLAPLSPSISPVSMDNETTINSPKLNALNEDENTDTSSPIFPILVSQSKTASMSMMNLKSVVGAKSCPDKNNTMATSLPNDECNMNMKMVIPTSNLDAVETTSCPDLDTAYQRVDIEINTNIEKVREKIDYKTKMKAYCIATIKHNIDIIYHWIYYYPSDFADHKLLNRLLEYITKVKNKLPAQNSIVRRWNKLLQLIQHRKPQMKYQSILSSSISNLRIIPKVRKHDRKTSFQFTDSFFPPREMVSKLGGGVDLLKIHPALVADQLTLIDTEIFLQIKAREFTNRSWQSRPIINDSNIGTTDIFGDDELYKKLNRQKIDSPNLLYMIDHVNRLSLWVATEILNRNTTAEMADLTKYFYVVAHRCLELCNIHTCTAIFGGICLQPLTRLRRLNRYLSDDEQIKQLHSALNQMISSNNNYKTYRNFMEQWYNNINNNNNRPTPCIPFIPVVMKDLFQIQLNLITMKKCECKNSNENEEIKCIDLGLLEKNCRHIRRVYEAQQKAKLYANQLPADTDIQSKLRMNIAKFETHDVLRKWSFEIQPKLTKEDKENLEMIDTLEEFGFL